MRRMKILALILMLFITFSGCSQKNAGMHLLEEAKPLASAEEPEDAKKDKEDIAYIFVHVCGAVKREGVYELPYGSRVYEAIEAAGGFCEEADVRNVNQAEVLEDEERVYVPVIGEEVQTDSDEGGKININKASKEQLMTLPGVGASRAESIIAYRKEQGSFQSIEDIMQVSGIKEGLFEKIKDLITI